MVNKTNKLIRFANLSDLPDIINNENSAHYSPWSEKLLAESIEGGHLVWVIEIDSQIVGHLIVMSVIEQWELLDIVIAPCQQGKGLGKLCMEHLQKEAKLKYVKSIFLEVRVSNQAAIKLYKKFGFVEVGRRKKYYQCVTGREDALVMQYSF
ncbi:ribosomal protein S18-alanine N-acetyltransferase [Aliikangiella sp. IMCC44359]|uniref:ribosomal protein S18-alanine N-acetyltransferase n=1 Tax=Aliikangiella sp. IMCC44359 TaxID=3459125 RepID=UPI00403AB370